MNSVNIGCERPVVILCVCSVCISQNAQHRMISYYEPDEVNRSPPVLELRRM